MNRDREKHPDPATLSLFYDGEGPSEFTEAIAGHVTECEECSRALEQLDRLARELRATPELTAPASVLAGVRAAITETRPSGLDPIADLQVQPNTALTLDPWEAQRAVFIQVPRRYGAIAALFVVVAMLGFLVWWSRPPTESAHFARIDETPGWLPETASSALVDSDAVVGDASEPRSKTWSEEDKRFAFTPEDSTARARAELSSEPSAAASNPEIAMQMKAVPPASKAVNSSALGVEPSGELAEDRSAPPADGSPIKIGRTEPNDSNDSPDSSARRSAPVTDLSTLEMPRPQDRADATDPAATGQPMGEAGHSKDKARDRRGSAKGIEAGRYIGGDEGGPSVPTVAYLPDGRQTPTSPGLYVIVETPPDMTVSPNLELEFTSLLATCTQEARAAPQPTGGTVVQPRGYTQTGAFGFTETWPADRIAAQSNGLACLEIQIDRAQLPAVLAAVERLVAPRPPEPAPLDPAPLDPAALVPAPGAPRVTREQDRETVDGAAAGAMRKKQLAERDEGGVDDKRPGAAGEREKVEEESPSERVRVRIFLFPRKS